VKIPKIIHFVWVGSSRAMPDTNLESLIDWARQNPGFEISLWVDKESQPFPLDKYYTETITKLGGTELLKRIKVKDISEEEVSTKYVRYEIDRLRPNYGAASDLLRYRILHKFGGAYFDSDIKPGGQSLSDSKIFDVDHDGHVLYVDPNSQNMHAIGNDGFICTAGNPEIKQISTIAEGNYSAAKMINRNKGMEFDVDHSPIIQAVASSSVRYIRDDTPVKTGGATVRLVTEQLYSDSDARIRELQGDLREHVRHLGNTWLNVPVQQYPNLEKGIEAVVGLVRFEAELGFLRMEDHVNHLSCATNEDRDVVSRALISRLRGEKIDFSKVKAIQLTELGTDIEKFYNDCDLSSDMAYLFPNFEQESSLANCKLVLPYLTNQEGLVAMRSNILKMTDKISIDQAWDNFTGKENIYQSVDKGLKFIHNAFEWCENKLKGSDLADEALSEANKKIVGDYLLLLDKCLDTYTEFNCFKAFKDKYSDSLTEIKNKIKGVREANQLIEDEDEDWDFGA